MYKQDQNGVLEVQDEVQRFRVMVGGSRKESESKRKRWRVRLLFRGMNKAKRLSRIGFIQLLTEVLLHILMVLSELRIYKIRHAHTNKEHDTWICVATHRNI